VGELAEKVRIASAKLGLRVAVRHLFNPRVEREEHYYNAVHTRLLDLGLEPHLLSESLLDSLLEIAIAHRDRVREDVILPRVDWRATHNRRRTRPDS
jgi:UDP-sulfoquinovose synthase